MHLIKQKYDQNFALLMKALTGVLWSLMLGVLLCSSCMVAKNGPVASTAGTYTVQVVKTKTGSNPVITGTLFNYHDGSLLRTNGAVKANDSLKTRTDINGNFTFSVRPGKYKFTGFGVPYQFLTTDQITVSKGDSVKVIMRIKADFSPTYD